MFSKPLGVVLFALACLTAAAGGAYVATRHNAADTTALAAPQPTRPAPAPGTSGSTASAASAPSQPVAETEAPVTVAKAEAPPAESPSVTARKPEVPAVASKPSPAPSREAARPAEKVPQPAAAHDDPPPARPVQRTVPLTNAGPPVSQADSAWSPSASAPAGAGTAPKPATDGGRPADDPQPEPARVPQFDELILPSASVIGLQVETSLSTERARIEDRVDARVSRDVMAGGRVAIPAGSRVIGSVTTVERGGKVKEQARLGIRFHTLVLGDGTQLQLHTDPIYRLGEAPANSSSKKIGGAAIGGAILGAILGGGKGAAIGSAAGAAGGTAAVMAGDRNAAMLRQGEYLNIKLASPATITVERRE